MDRLFDQFFGGPGPARATGFSPLRGFAPSLDVSETDTEITVRAEVPGIDPKDLEVSVSGNVLTLAGEKKESTERKGENYYQAERRFGSFRRTIQLPTEVNCEKISAEHRNGILMIRLPKVASAAPKRIPVTVPRD
jgi:HSP20 family protein